MDASGPRFKRLLAEGAAVGVLALACAIFFRDAVALKGVFFYYDHSVQNFPYRLFFANGLRDGGLKLWTNDLFCGFPLFAEGQGNPLYPLFPLLFGLLKPWVAYNYYTVLHFFLAGFFTYLLARTLEIARPGAVLAGLCYMLAGPIVAHTHHTNIVVGICYLPLLLALIEMAFRRNSLTPVFLFTLATASLILGAQPQYTVYVALACGLFLLWRFWLTARWGNAPKGLRRAALLTGAFGLSALLAAGISTVQLLPFLELAQRSSRSVAGPPLAYGTSMPPANLITMFLPHYFGSPGLDSYWGQGWVGAYAETAIYLGFVPVLLALIGCFSNRQRKVLFFAALAVFSFIFSLGLNGSLYWLLADLPVFRSTRFSARFGFVTALSVALLAGWGLQTLCGCCQGRGERRRPILIALALALALCVAYIAVAGASNRELRSLTHPALAAALPLRARFIEILENHLHGTLPADIWHLVAAAAAGTALVMLSVARIIPKGLTCVLGCVLVFSELAFCGRAEAAVTDPAVYEGPPEIVRIIKKRGPGRVFQYRLYDPHTDTLAGYPSPSSQGWAVHRGKFKDCLNTLPLNSNMIWNVPSLSGFSPLQTLSLKTLLGRPEATQTVIPFDISPALDLLGARYILTGRASMPQKYRLLAEIGGLRLYENPAALPRTFIVHRARRCADPDAALAELVSPSFDYRNELLLHGSERPRRNAVKARSAPGESAVILRDTGDLITVKARLRGPGYLVLADQFYPGWEALVDGRARPVLKADYMLKAVGLPGGTHTVQFRFRPRSFRIGLSITMGSLVALFLWICATALLEARRGGRPPAEKTPLTDTAYSGKALRLTLLVGGFLLLVSPVCNIEAWKLIPTGLNPRTYVAKRSLVLSFYAEMEGDRLKSYSYLLRACRWRPGKATLRRALLKRGEPLLYELLSTGRIGQARRMLTELRQVAPDIVREQAYRRREARVAIAPNDP